MFQGDSGAYNAYEKWKDRCGAQTRYTGKGDNPLEGLEVVERKGPVCVGGDVVIDLVVRVECHPTTGTVGVRWTGSWRGSQRKDEDSCKLN